MASGGESEEEEQEWLCDSFLEILASLINKENVQAILSEQDHMYDCICRFNGRFMVHCSRLAHSITAYVNGCTCHVSFRLETLEVANEKLSSLNSLSEKSFALHAADFRSHTRTIANMKKELDSVFRRIRYPFPPLTPASLMDPPTAGS